MKTFLTLTLLAMCAISAGAQAPADVPRDHWAYQAVSDLISKGYAEGYADGSFLGNRELTRYEFATVIKRIVDDLDAKVASIPRTKAETSSAPAASAAPAVSGVSQADLDAIRKLFDEFKPELAVIGTRLDKVEAELSTMSVTLKNIDTIVSDPEGPLETARADIKKLQKIAVSGYVQTRYQSLVSSEDKKEDVDDTFNIRRARIKVTGKPTDKSVAVLQIDMGGNKVGVKDAYVTYNFAGDPTLGPSLTVGQQNWWFGYEVAYSSSRRETPERALFVRRFFPGERDRGARLMVPFGKNWVGQVAVYDGSGIENYTSYKVLAAGNSSGKDQKVQSGIGRDFNSKKDILANFQYNSENFDFGLSGYFGKGVWDKDRADMDATTDKIRFGADLRYYWDRMTLKAEYIRGKGIDEVDTTKWKQDDWIDGYYAQLNYNLSRSNVLVARYDSVSDDARNPQYGRRSAWNYGLIHYLDDSQKLKLFYQVNSEEKSSFDNNAAIAEWVLIY